MNANTLDNGNGLRKRSRTLFVPGFVLGLLLSTAIACGGALYAIGLDSGGFAELRGQSAQVWTPPPAPAAPAEVQTLTTVDDDATAEATLRRNVTASLVNVRATPGYLGKPASDVIAQIAPGRQVAVLDGPQLVDGLNWWRIRLLPAEDAAEDVAQGWVAEATASGVQILGE